MAKPYKSFPLQAWPMRLVPKEDIMEELNKYVQFNSIRAAFIITGVGSVRSVHLRYATGPDGKEKEEVIEENMEICSLSGTCSGKGFHIHGTFGKADGSTVSGHIVGKMIVQTTAEIVLGSCEGAYFYRMHDPNTGFKELLMG